ncbi:hypothetical protein TNCV_1168021 [Trichonephila clavipes]|uniref:Uncharacterized protein n=1 Tax=Trichonephila clavipes TaxID=2585209 RepID=A0A8X6T533_TRICX|nr:hypothetical protein TNCV_1168021 [Trichonephila clavipes]
MVTNTEPLVMCATGTKIVSLREEVRLAMLKKLLRGSNKISVPLGSRTPYMRSMTETALMLLCLGQAVDKMNLARLHSGQTRAQPTCGGS